MVPGGRSMLLLLYLGSVFADALDMDLIPCSSSTSSVADKYKLESRYAPSILVCSFLCSSNTDCVLYSYDNYRCSLYWEKILGKSSTAIGASKIWCNLHRQANNCPAAIDGSTFLCLPLDSERSCTCILTYSLSWENAGDVCAKYGMELITVYTPAKNKHINLLIDTYNKDMKIRFWTSGKQVSQTPPLSDVFKWTSSNVTVTGPGVWPSFWAPGEPNFGENELMCINYRYGSSTSNWLYGDYACSAQHLALCEFKY